jgi:hypothetical protein
VRTPLLTTWTSQKPYSNAHFVSIEKGRRRFAWLRREFVAYRASQSRVHLYHDGELSDVAVLAHALGAEVEDRPGKHAVLDPSEPNPAIVIATPGRVMQFQPLLDATRPTLIVVLDGDSRMLRAHLRRIDVDMLVRRPVHPEALRLLLLHVLYRGPNRRGRERVTIGAPIKVKSGLFARAAILTELSLRGCRLLSRTRFKSGRSIRLLVPAAITGGGALKLSGSVVRTIASSDRASGVWTVGVRFNDPTRRVTDRIKAIIDDHTSGPACIDSASTKLGAAAMPAEDGHDDIALEAAGEPAESNESHIDGADKSDAAGDRRTADRHSYDQHVVALGQEATRVLLGRELSTRGMRVSEAPGLCVGDKLRLAIHSGVRNEPLVLEAEVYRDDGESGLVLRFDPDEGEVRQLGQMLVHLPLLDGDTGGGEDIEDESACGIVLSEIIEHEAG